MLSYWTLQPGILQDIYFKEGILIFYAMKTVRIFKLFMESQKKVQDGQALVIFKSSAKSASSLTKVFRH